MAITNLYSTFAYPSTGASMPIVAVMHGYAANAYQVPGLLDRMARYGVFAIGVGMRGRNSATGSQDASGREIMDIRDAIEYVKTTYAALVDADHICVAGYSGGGGNALAFATKFPDYANVIASHFGISDYGWADYSGSGLNTAWGYYPSGTLAWIGDTPNNVPNAYRSRNAPDAIANFSGGHLYLFHDNGDGSVPIIHSQRIVTAMGAAGLTNYTASYTSASDSPRWIHGDPVIGDAGEPCIQTEPIWLQTVANKSVSPWTIPASGTVTVNGYIVTKRFSVWLGGLTEAAAGAGLDEVATVAYNTATGVYTVTPITGAMDVFIKQGSLSVSASITEATDLTAV
jgi:hypothetical protein